MRGKEVEVRGRRRGREKGEEPRPRHTSLSSLQVGARKSGGESKREGKKEQRCTSFFTRLSLLLDR